MDHVKSGKSLRPWQISYEFDSTIANWRERLALAYEMLFAKIEEMEEPVIKEKKEDEEV